MNKFLYFLSPPLPHAKALRAMGAACIVAAAPVGAEDSVAALEEDADEVVVLETPAWFNAVGQWYNKFGQTTDDEVRGLLARNRRVLA